MRRPGCHRTSRTLLSLAILLLVPAAAWGETVDLVADRDNTLFQDNSGSLSNGAGDYVFSGITQSRRIRRALVRFDVAGNIPAGSTINSATLTLYMSWTSANTGDETHTVHVVLEDWGEAASDSGGDDITGGGGGGAAAQMGDATWFHTFYNTAFWTTPGGNFDATASATQIVGGQGPYTWTSAALAADVQSWLDNPAGNFGWIVRGREIDRRSAKRFNSREHPDPTRRPVLSIDFTPPDGACCEAGGVCSVLSSADCSTAGGTFQGGGTSCVPNPCTAPTGACCDGSGACSELSAISCAGAGGSYLGDGTTCIPNLCPQPTGACCAGDGTCTEVTSADCAAVGGTYQGNGSLCSLVDCPIVLTKYIDPLPIPVTATPTSGTPGGAATYDISMTEFQQQLHSELPPTVVWGYDDGSPVGPLYPGPTIEAGMNQTVTVNWINDLRYLATGFPRTDHYLGVDTACIHGAENSAKTVVHLHGGHVSEQSDGYPEFTYTPGFQDTYTYPNGQLPATLWYHDHALGITRYNVYMGLAGFYLLRDPFELSLNLPSGEYEIPLAIQDRKFNPDGTLKYPATWQDHFVGDKILVNGKVWPYLEVKQGKYRFRVLGGSGSRFYALSLLPPSGSLDFTVIGTEGGLLEAPVPGVGTLGVGPGERYDVVVDFSAFLPGDEILLQNGAPTPFPSGVVDVTDVMKFIVVGTPGHTDPLPPALRPIARLQEGDAVLSRDFRLRKGGNDGCGRNPWLINDLTWNDITEYPELDTVEIWRFINDSGVSHPMHMHLVMFQILDRDTFTVGPGGEIIPDNNPVPPLPEENGWKDTAIVDPGEILRVIARFETFKGKYAYHCHILEHEDHEMMRQFQTVRCGDAEVDPSEECDDGARVSGDGCSDRCEAEEFFQLAGSAGGGGTVDLTIDGVLISVPTGPGDTPADVVAALVAAIHADPTLAGLGVTAAVDGDRLITNGTIQDALVGDGGLTDLLTLQVQPGLLWWATTQGAIAYDVVQGLAGPLATGGFTAATGSCLAEDSAATSMALPPDPAPGEALWFLVREVEGGGNGTYDTGAPSQAGPRDADIAASGNDCS